MGATSARDEPGGRRLPHGFDDAAAPQVEALYRLGGHLRDHRLRGGEPDAHPVPDVRQGRDLGPEAVERRSGARLTGELDADLPRERAHRDRALGAVGAAYRSAALELDPR